MYSFDFIKLILQIYIRSKLKNPWKFQSIQKLSTKVGSSPNSSSPLGLSIKFDSFPGPQRQESESNALIYKPMESKQQYAFSSQNQKQFGKANQFGKFEQIQKKSRQRQQPRKSKGLSAKMKAKLQQQLKTAYRHLEEKDAQLNGLNSQIESLSLVLRQKKRSSEDLVNNEQMLLFKQKQLNNLITIHGQLLEGAKKDILNEKNTKVSYEEKILALKKKIAELSYKCNQKRQFRQLIDQIKEQKLQMQNLLAQRKETAIKKSQIRNDAIRELLHDLIKRKKRQLQEQCQHKVRIIRQTSNNLKKPQDLKTSINKRGILPSDYYTFAQLKYVSELNFRVNKDSQKIMEIFYNQINPKIPQIIQRFQQPTEYIKLKEQLNNLNKGKQKNEEEVKKRQKELQVLQLEKSKLKKSLSQLKEKNLAVK